MPAADAVLAFVDALPCPAIALDEGGFIVLANAAMREYRALDEAACVGHLADRFPEYEGALRGDPRWSTPQEASVARREASGTVDERLVVREMPGGSCLFVENLSRLRQVASADAQTLRLASLGFMLAGASHELSNPLAAIYSMVQMLRAHPQADRPELQKALAHIGHNVHRMLEISQRLCGFARVGDAPGESFRVDDALDESVALLEQSGQLGQVNILRTCDPQARVEGNPGQLREVFHNILLNAVQAMEGHGRLKVATSRVRAGEVQVAFHDNGPGIPPASMPRLFEPFFSTKPNGKGTGLGLSISNEIVHEHGGRIRVENDATRGAWFFVELPLAGARP